MSVFIIFLIITGFTDYYCACEDFDRTCRQ